jgi:4-hydroxyphenylpyruvate dioxygenase-like putative hemolysin
MHKKVDNLLKGLTSLLNKLKALETKLLKEADKHATTVVKSQIKVDDAKAAAERANAIHANISALLVVPVKE